MTSGQAPTPPRVLLVDNYDSFVGNLYQYLGELGADPVIRRNDAVASADVEAGGFTHLVVSPGPKTPADAGASVDLIRAFAGRLPILGVCLGHQAIGAAFGGRVVGAKDLLHGKTSEIRHGGKGVLAGLPSPFVAARYHSLALHPATLPDDLEVTATTDDKEVMAIRHRGFDVPLEGVQFHPEAILTEHGHALLANFLGLPAPFTTILVRDGAPVRIDAHMERLVETAAAFALPRTPDRAAIAEKCRARAAAAGADPARMHVSLRPGLVTIEVAAFAGYPPEDYENGAVALLADDLGHPLGARAGKKALPYDALNALREAAKARGATDVILRDADGALLEGTASNLFLVRDGEILTPPTTRPILPGVTRAAVLAAARELGVAAREVGLFPDDLATADEAFLTGSLMELLPLCRAGDATFAPGPVARRLAAELRKGR